MKTPYACRRFDQAVLCLADHQPVGMGNRRQVFVHPDYPSLCIKIARHAHIRQSLNGRGLLYRVMPTRWRDDNWLEARAYQQKALRDDMSVNWHHVPRLHGWQETDLGAGLVFDYFRNIEGGPAPNLQDLLADAACPIDIGPALAELRAFLAKSDLWMRHPGPANIVLAVDGRLKLIDCLGTYNMHVMRHIGAVRRRRRARHIAYLDTAITRAKATQHAQ